MSDLAHIHHVELLTPEPERSLAYFHGVLGMDEESREGQSVFLRGWGEYQPYSLKLTESGTSGLAHMALRASSPGALARLARVLDVDQLVGGDGEAEPGAGLAPGVEHDALVVAVAEDVGGEVPAGGDVARQQVDVVEALDRGAAGRVALRLVAQRRLEVRRRHVAIGLPQHLHDVAVGVVEAVGAAVAVVAVDPADAETGGLDRLDAAGERVESR